MDIINAILFKVKEEQTGDLVTVKRRKRRNKQKNNQRKQAELLHLAAAFQSVAD